ncbi:DUF2169 family type VI secretion system accessory protein [Paraliomyxa miuraensis]|uniref:DUF2169 family type VI secretion system accessory protein n=1 Tax=Paraliomyxa miuraensis TaxID=376150 RepID=UPI0022562BAD|nr:DUF2169 domain-containing protein [Paraliomyxa miuraensis]MCX4247158.1 DUF2169 domain-containing protein [Paraliomyxa miuraensis]
MKVVKPNKLSVLTRPFEHERRFYLGVSLLMFVPLPAEPPSGPVLLSEVALWKFVAQRMGMEGVLDVGIPKLRGEFLVHGTCHAPGGIPHPMVPVRARVGEVEKTLMVHGDRYWKPGRVASEPQPFTEMPLHWARAFGGPRYKRNPLGRGHGESEYMGQRVQMLPNIELADALVSSPNDKPDPVGLGALDVSWPQRRELAGTYDKRWLHTLFPGMAADIDWRFFNLAQPDQHTEGAWNGDEDYQLDNMHPTRPSIQGQLPGLVGRAFVSRRGKAGEPLPPAARRLGGEAHEAAEAPLREVELEEVELSLRTLWLFPDAERAVLIFQGSTHVVEDDASDIVHLVLAAEHRDAPRTTEAYAEALQARLDPDHGIIAALRDHELLPELADGGIEDELARERALCHTERRLEHNLHRRALREHERAKQQLTTMGLDPADFLTEPKPPPPTPSPDELPALVQQLTEEAEERRVREEAEQQQRQQALRQRLEAMDLPVEDRERLLHQHEHGPTGPPTFTAAGQRAELQAVVERTRAVGAPTEALEQMLADPAQQQRWVEAEAKLREGYLRSAHLQDPAPRMTAARSEEARQAVREALAAGTSFATLNLTGADLSGMDLVGADLSGALLESACLDGADLRRAKLHRAVLAHASLQRARLDGADLSRANLGRSVLCEASAVEANLHEAELMEADLARAVLRGADLRGASVLRIVLTDADASEIRTERLMLVEAKATGTKLCGAQLRTAVFLELDLRGADFSHAQLGDATFLGCQAPGSSFTGANLDGARFVKDCVLDDASLVVASLRACNLRGTSLRGADLSGSTLDGADLSECTLVGAKLHRAVARGTRFEKTDLADASLLAANLFQASFLGARIEGADLRATNLHGADMARIYTDERVRLEEANLEKVRIHPRHEPRASPPTEDAP